MRKDTRGQVAGGLGLLAAAAVLCFKGLKAVDRRLREKGPGKEEKPEEKQNQA